MTYIKAATLMVFVLRQRSPLWLKKALEEFGRSEFYERSLDLMTRTTITARFNLTRSNESKGLKLYFSLVTYRSL